MACMACCFFEGLAFLLRFSDLDNACHLSRIATFWASEEPEMNRVIAPTKKYEESPVGGQQSVQQRAHSLAHTEWHQYHFPLHLYEGSSCSVGWWS